MHGLWARHGSGACASLGPAESGSVLFDGRGWGLGLVLAAFEGARLLYHVEAAVLWLWLLVALLLAWALWLLPFRGVPWE